MPELPRRSQIRPPSWRRAGSGAAAYDHVLSIAMAIGVVLLANCLALASHAGGRTPVVGQAEASAVDTAPIAVEAHRPPARSGVAKPRLLPVQVAAPRVGIRAAVTKLGRAKDGSLEVPADYDLTGWYAAGPAPGERGAAVVVGHVDDFTGPAVFHRLGQLRKGDRVDVRRTDGSVVQFTVQFTATYSKDDFPTGLVYQPTDGPTLRLVTCGGEFDRRSRRYESNVVVFASATRVVPPPKK